VSCKGKVTLATLGVVSLLDLCAQNSPRHAVGFVLRLAARSAGNMNQMASLWPLSPKAQGFIVVAGSLLIVGSMVDLDQLTFWSWLVVMMVAFATGLFVERRLRGSPPSTGQLKKVESAPTDPEHISSALDRWIIWLLSKPSWVGRSLGGLIVAGPIAILAMLAFDDWLVATVLFVANFTFIAATARRPDVPPHG